MDHSADRTSHAAASTNQQRARQRTVPRRDLHKRFRWLLRSLDQFRKGNLPFASKLAYALPLPRSCPHTCRVGQADPTPRWTGRGGLLARTSVPKISKTKKWLLTFSLRGEAIAALPITSLVSR